MWGIGRAGRALIVGRSEGAAFARGAVGASGGLRGEARGPFSIDKEAGARSGSAKVDFSAKVYTRARSARRASTSRCSPWPRRGFLSRSRARGAKNARARALNRTRRAGYSLAPVVGASELARSWGNRHRVLFARIQKREFCWFPVAPVVGEKKGRKVSVTARSRARALLSRTDYLSIHRSIDRLEKKSKNDGRVCARAAFWSRVAARRR